MNNFIHFEIQHISIILIQMGICTSDPLTYLIKEYGEDVCKYLVSIKSEQFIDQTAPKMIERIQETFKNTAGTLDKEFDSKSTAIKGNFDSVIKQVKQSNSAALETVKTKQNKTQEQLFGLNSIQQQFNKLKSTKDQKLKDQETNIIKILTEKKDSLKKSISDSKPSLPLFDNMPVCLKQMVLSQGEEKFAPQIKQKQEEVLSIFERVANLDNLQGSIKKAVGLDEADKLVKNSSSGFDKAKTLVTALSNPAAAMKGGSCFG